LIVWGLPIGLGSYVQSDRKLDGRLAGALMSIPSVKEVEIGDALATAKDFGRSAHDVIVRENEQLTRRTNRAGGLEGGVTNGMPLVVRMTLKPISTQRKPLPSIDLDSGETVEGKYIRSDIAVVPAAAVIAEAMAGLVLADALLEKFGADRLDDLQAAIERHRLRAQQVGRPKGRS
jgi:chorismate synthase